MSGWQTNSSEPKMLCIQQKRKKMLCELDMEKADDQANWEFMFYFLGRCGSEVK